MKIHTGDNVVVITGKDKGKTGSVMKVLPVTGRIVVSGINMRTKHIKATPQQAGQKIQYEGSIAISNIMLVDGKTKKRTRVGFKIDEKGKKIRIAKRSGEAIEKKKITAKKPPSAEATAGREAPKAPSSASDSAKAMSDKEASAGREEDVKVKKVKEDKKVAKEEKIEKKAEEKVAKKEEVKKEEAPVAKKPETIEKIAGPAKKPFWKKMLSFGGAAADEAEVEGESHMKESHTIPDETPPNRRNTTRGA